ncbi:MAG: cellulose synthase operon protein YhjQ/BcsQ [Planctomycetota bacterium]|nr:cellulose synthase operon protein YhjQ/BcsQ [Planctomycetota bacterium]
MDPSFSVYTNYVTPAPIIVPTPDSQPNRKNRTPSDRTRIHEADDLHDQLEGNFETASGVERQYSDDYFHGIPISSFFVHPLAKNDSHDLPNQLVSAEYGIDNQTPVSSIPGLQNDSGNEETRVNNLQTIHETLGSVRHHHASPQPLVGNISSQMGDKEATQESNRNRDQAFSTGANNGDNNFAWPELVLELVDDPRGAIDSLGHTTLHLLGRGENRIGITSTRFGEGCSTIAASLALWASQLDQSVLLVDGHFNRPGLAQQLGIQAAPPWTLADHNSKWLEQRIHQPNGPSIGILPWAAECAMLESPRQTFDILGESVQSVSDRYDLILIDIGPVFQLMTELETANHLMDVAILTAAVNRTSIEERHRSQEILSSLGTQKMVVAENFAQRTWLEAGRQL